LLRRSGFEVLECRVEYDGQYVVAHARPSEGVAELDDARPWGDFRRVKAAIADWQDWASAHQRRGSRVALWGATSKAVSFMSFVDTLRPVVAVDINPRKAGGFLPATATPICGPAELASYDADTVLAMNPVYLSEIQAELDRLGNGAELLAVEYPSVAPTTR